MKPIITDIFKSDMLHAYHFICRDAAHSDTGLRQRMEYEICIPRDGIFGKRLHGRTFNYHSQSMMLTNRGEEHVLFHGDREDDHCTILLVNEFLLEEADYSFWQEDLTHSSGTGTPAKQRFPLPSLTVSPEIDYLHHRLIRIQANSASAGLRSTMEIEGLIVDLLAVIYGQMYGTHMSNDESSQRVKQANLEAVERAKAIMLQQYSEDLSLTDISQFAFKSKFHFVRLFKRTTNQTPYQYLLNIRLTHAEYLILETDRSITEISFASGFFNYPHFINTFTRRFGTSPLQYRRRYRSSFVK